MGLLLVAAAFFFSLGLYLFFTFKAGPAAPAFTASDVVYATPLHVDHHMDPETSKPPVTPERQAGDPPVAALSDRFFDFGEVDPPQVVTHAFSIRNNGGQSLVITGAHTTCGCTTADISATSIPPGKLALVTLRFDPAFHNLHGQTVRRGVMIETNDPQSPQVEIWIQAAIR